LPRGNPRPPLGRGVGVCGRCFLLEGTVVVTLSLLHASGESLRSRVVFFLKTPPSSSQRAALRWWRGGGAFFNELGASGQNLRSSGRTVTALLCRVILEDTVLELAVLRMTLSLRVATSGKSCVVPCLLAEFPWCCLLRFERRWSMHNGGRLLVALPAAGSFVDGVRVRWLSLG
jgi:hypothetical protein